MENIIYHNDGHDGNINTTNIDVFLGAVELSKNLDVSLKSWNLWYIKLNIV